MQTGNNIKIPEEDKIFIPDDGKTRNVYFRVNWLYASIYIWNEKGTYNNKGWPGTETYSIGYNSGYYYYKCEIPEGYNNFILARLKDTGGDFSGSKTQDLVFERNNILYTLNANGAVMSSTVYSGGEWQNIEDWL